MNNVIKQYYNECAPQPILPNLKTKQLNFNSFAGIQPHRERESRNMHNRKFPANQLKLD